MADSVVSLYNMALGNLGSTQLVNDVADTSKQAVQCGIFYPTARDLVLRASDWGFARTWAALAQIPFTVYSPIGYAYAYALPVDCLRALELYAGTRRPSADLRISFTIVQGAASNGVARYLLTDQAPVAAIPATSTAIATPAVPSLRYISRTTDVTMFPPDVDIAISWRLAALLAMPMAMEKGIKQQAEQMAALTLAQAAASTLNEDQADPPNDSSFQTARD